MCTGDAAASLRSPDSELQAYAAFCSWSGGFWQIEGTEDAVVVSLSARAYLLTGSTIINGIVGHRQNMAK